MPDATIAWLCSAATYNIEAIYNIVQQKFKYLSTYQPAYLSRERVRFEFQRKLSDLLRVRKYCWCDVTAI